MAPARHRHFLKSCLEEATSRAGEELGLEDAERPEVDHDTKGKPGMADIATTVLNKISESALFVADLTPIGRSDGEKALPNPNVLIELGWAMAKLGPERIIGIFNTADGWRVEDMPFDVRHRRLMPYNLPDGAGKATREAVRKKLVQELTEAIAVNLGEHAEQRAVIEEISGVPAASGDPSIWASARKELRHSDSLSAGHERTITFEHGGPRAYIRIVPASWPKGTPSVAEIRELPGASAVRAPIEGTAEGDGGPFEDGYVSYWITGWTDTRDPVTANVCCFMDLTGEIWAVHGTAVAQANLGPTIRHESVLGNWSATLRRAMTMMDGFGASQVRLVEVGLVALKGVRWHGQWESESPPARRDTIQFRRQSRDWSDDAQLIFLKAGFDRMLDNFSVGRSSPEYFQSILQQWDQERFEK